MEKSDRKQERATRRPPPTVTVRRQTTAGNRRAIHGLHLADGPDYRDPESTGFTPDHPRIAA